MFEVGFQELVLVFVIALLILGPERLPRVAAQAGRWVGRARRMANQLRYQLEREIALEEYNRTHKPGPKPPSESSTAGDDPSSPSAEPSAASAADDVGAGDASADVAKANSEAGDPDPGISQTAAGAGAAQAPLGHAVEGTASPTTSDSIAGENAAERVTEKADSI